MEYMFAMLLCPFLVIILSKISLQLFRKWFIAPIITFVIFTVLTYTNFGSSFFFWVVIYTVISLVTSIPMIK